MYQSPAGFTTDGMTFGEEAIQKHFDEFFADLYCEIEDKVVLLFLPEVFLAQGHCPSLLGHYEERFLHLSPVLLTSHCFSTALLRS